MNVMLPSDARGDAPPRLLARATGLAIRLVTAGLILWIGSQAPTSGVFVGFFSLIFGLVGAYRGRGERLRLAGNLAIIMASVAVFAVAIHFRDEAQTRLATEAAAVQADCQTRQGCPRLPDGWEERSNGNAGLSVGPAKLFYRLDDDGECFSMEYSPAIDVAYVYTGGTGKPLTGEYWIDDTSVPIVADE